MATAAWPAPDRRRSVRRRQRRASLTKKFGKPPERTALGTAGDIGVTALKGAVGLPQTAVGLLNILDTINRGTAPPGMREAAGDLTSRPGVAQALANAGLRFDDAQKALDTFYSAGAAGRQPQGGRGRRFRANAPGRAGEPSTIGHTAIESVPQMLGGAAIGRAIASAAPRVAPGWPARRRGRCRRGRRGRADPQRPGVGRRADAGPGADGARPGATTAATAPLADGSRRSWA